MPNALTAVETLSGILVHGLASGEHHLVLYDALGRIILGPTEQNSTGEDVALKGSINLSSGMYILRADNKDLVKVWVDAR